MKQPNYQYRFLTEHDLLAINDVIKEAVMAWPIAARLRRLSATVLIYDEMDLAHYQGYVAVSHEQVIGCILWDPEHQDSLIHGLYVAPNHQTMGVGKQLLEQVYNDARDNGKKTIHVKAERVSCGYFEHLGMRFVEQQSPTSYPYLFSKLL